MWGLLVYSNFMWRISCNTITCMYIRYMYDTLDRGIFKSSHIRVISVQVLVSSTLYRFCVWESGRSCASKLPNDVGKMPYGALWCLLLCMLATIVWAWVCNSPSAFVDACNSYARVLGLQISGYCAPGVKADTWLCPGRYHFRTMRIPKQEKES